MMPIGEPILARQVHYDTFKGTRRGYHPECLVFHCSAVSTPPVGEQMPTEHG
ncbi:hypothetical protein KAI30_02340 [Candidatus Bathyarchaeota archaeon]|nr:hypothetical protein [Candidatus Bathyarchaeota archaeon]